MKLTQADATKAARRRELKIALAEKFRGLSAAERSTYIPVEFGPTEFEIQAFLYESLRRLGYQVRGEVQTKCGTCIFDLVVFIARKPVRVIEVKKRKKPTGFSKAGVRRALKDRTQQVDRYRQFGLPVDLVCTIHEARDYVAKLEMAGF